MSGETRVATASQTVGPFFHFGLTQKPNGRLVERLGAGEAITLVIRVTDGDGAPLPDALVEVMQDGVFWRMPTDDDGTCVFETVRARVSADRPGHTASHVFVCLFARGLLRQVQTRIYFAGDPALDLDPVLALVPPERRPTLLARPDPADGQRWTFALRLQGADETVFFAE
jgi:protocatechuate 3,4-dioxygenase alpha subunit